MPPTTKKLPKISTSSPREHDTQARTYLRRVHEAIVTDQGYGLLRRHDMARPGRMEDADAYATVVLSVVDVPWIINVDIKVITGADQWALWVVGTSVAAEKIRKGPFRFDATEAAQVRAARDAVQALLDAVREALLTFFGQRSVDAYRKVLRDTDEEHAIAALVHGVSGDPIFLLRAAKIMAQHDDAQAGATQETVQSAPAEDPAVAAIERLFIEQLHGMGRPDVAAYYSARRSTYRNTMERIALAVKKKQQDQSAATSLSLAWKSGQLREQTAGISGLGLYAVAIQADPKGKAAPIQGYALGHSSVEAAGATLGPAELYLKPSQANVRLVFKPTSAIPSSLLAQASIGVADALVWSFILSPKVDPRARYEVLKAWVAQIAKIAPGLDDLPTDVTDEEEVEEIVQTVARALFYHLFQPAWLRSDGEVREWAEESPGLLGRIELRAHGVRPAKKAKGKSTKPAKVPTVEAYATTRQMIELGYPRPVALFLGADDRDDVGLLASWDGIAGEAREEAVDAEAAIHDEIGVSGEEEDQAKWWRAAKKVGASYGLPVGWESGFSSYEAIDVLASARRLSIALDKVHEAIDLEDPGLSQEGIPTSLRAAMDAHIARAWQKVRAAARDSGAAAEVPARPPMIPRPVTDAREGKQARRNPAPTYAGVLHNPARGMNKKGNAIQSLLFARSKGWTKTNAQQWATSHGFQAPNTAIEITDSEVRIRQMDPSLFGSFSTFDLSKAQGIQAVYGLGGKAGTKR